MKTEEFYENKYKNETEPWNYSGRAAEFLRHEFIHRQIRRLNSQSKKILDVGCGYGQLTFKLDGASEEIHGIDVSHTALQKAESKYLKDKNNLKSKFSFSKENILSTSFPDNHFDLIILSDGIKEWFGSDEIRMKALAETHRILKPGGFALISDYQKYKNFDSYLNLIGSTSLKIREENYFYDRLCFQFYSWFKAVESFALIKNLFKNIFLAKILIGISSLLGKKGAKHLIVVAVKSYLLIINFFPGNIEIY